MDHHKNKKVVVYCPEDVACRPAGSSRHVHGVKETAFDFNELYKALRPVGHGHHNHHGHQEGHHGHHHHEHQVGRHHGHHHHEHQVGHHGHHSHHHHGHVEKRETTIESDYYNPRTGGVVHRKESVIITTNDDDDDTDSDC